MKIRLLVILNLSILFSCTSSSSEKTSYVFNEGPVIITGQLENSSDGTVLLTLMELAGRVDHVAKVDSAGNFRFDIQILSSHDNYIYIGGHTATIFLEANDSVYFEADASKFQQSVRYSGDKNHLNQAINSFFSGFLNRLESSEFFLMKRDLEPNEFKAFASAFFSDLQSTADSLSSFYDLKKQESSWLNNFVKYRYAEDLLEYAFHHSDLPSDYYSFEEDIITHDEYAIQCSQYYEDFISKYYLGTLLSRKDGFDEMIEQYSQQTYHGLIEAIDFIDLHIPNSIVKDVSITQLIYSLIGSEPQVVDSAYAYFSNVVTDVTCQNFIARHVDEQLEREIHSMSIEELANLDYIGSIFSDIQNTCSGKVLFIDFWGTWCGGCIGAFPHTQKLYESLNSKPVEFIYLCMSSNENEWQNTINKYSLEGKHYNLSRDQSAVLREVFRFNGVPRYMLVDKGGQFVDYDAKDPYSEVLKEDILNLL